jgi:hypothetical protein
MSRYWHFPVIGRPVIGLPLYHTSLVFNWFGLFLLNLNISINLVWYSNGLSSTSERLTCTASMYDILQINFRIDLIVGGRKKNYHIPQFFTCFIVQDFYTG